MKNPIRNIKKNSPFIKQQKLGLAALTLPMYMSQAHAVGLQLMPSSSNFGTAGAGHAAEGAGAGSAWANPATMSLVEGNQIGFGTVIADTDIQFQAEDPTANSGGDSGALVAIPSFSYVHSVNDDFKLGFSVVVPFGSEIDYGTGWAGSNAVTSASVETIQAQPVFSYRVNENLSLGGGFNINYTTAKQDLAPEGSATIPLVGDLDINSDISLEADDFAYGWTAGALWEFNPEHRVGVVYRSKVESDLEGDASANIDYTLTPGRGDPSSGTLVNTTMGTSLNWKNPGSVVVSGYHRTSEKTALLWDLGRTFYSDFETTSIELDGLPVSLDLERNWQDANRYAIGGHYYLNDKLTLQAGFSLDESPVETQYRTADLPLDDIKRYTVGAVYDMNEDISLAASVEYADLGDATVVDHHSLLSSPAGDYENSAIAGSFSVNYKF